VTWSALPGKTHQVEWRPSLEAGVSGTALTTVVADETVESFDDPEAFFATEGFYRVVQMP